MSDEPSLPECGEPRCFQTTHGKHARTLREFLGVIRTKAPQLLLLGQMAGPPSIVEGGSSGTVGTGGPLERSGGLTATCGGALVVADA